jgi:hypothetical protein
MDEAVEEAVLRDPREHVILEAARPQKIPSMLEDGVEKVIQGMTAISELERVVELPTIASITASKKILPSEVKDDDFLSHII